MRGPRPLVRNVRRTAQRQLCGRPMETSRAPVLGDQGPIGRPGIAKADLLSEASGAITEPASLGEDGQKASNCQDLWIKVDWHVQRLLRKGQYGVNGG